jgi:phosphatidylglycerol---prolipoprotein diacylglyceryl transferase
VHPVLYHIGSLTLRSYGVLLALSFFIGIYVARARAPRHGIDPQRLLDVYLLIVVAALVGSRLLYVAEHVSQYTEDPGRLLQLRRGGLSMYGGVVLAVIAAGVYCKRTGVPFLNLADTCAPSLALGEAITRIGCFLNGCCFGKPSMVPWAMVFPPHSAAGEVFAGVAIHPTQLYASLAHFAIFAVLLAAGRKTQAPGTLIGLFLVLHATARLGAETLRYQAPSALAFGFAGGLLTPSKVVCVGLFALGCYLLVMTARATPKVAAARSR